MRAASCCGYNEGGAPYPLSKSESFCRSRSVSPSPRGAADPPGDEVPGWAGRGFVDLGLRLQGKAGGVGKAAGAWDVGAEHWWRCVPAPGAQMHE